MSRNVRFIGKYPGSREGGEVLASSDLAGFTVDVKLKAAPESAWTKDAAVVSYPKADVLMPDHPIGEWQARFITRGTKKGDDSDPVIVDYLVEENLSKMGKMEEIKVTVE